LPEAVRRYAWARLDAAGEVDPCQGRLVDRCLHLLDGDHDGPASGAGTAACLDVEAELANFRHALDWACRHGPHAAVRLTGRLWRFCRVRGRYAEGRSWTVRALDAMGAAGGTPTADPAIANLTAGLGSETARDMARDMARDIARAQHGAGCPGVPAVRLRRGARASRRCPRPVSAGRR
jgi:hypothetical protein